MEQALIARYGSLGRVTTQFLLRSDNSLVFTSRSYTALARSYGLQQEFITPHCPQQNGMVERVIRTLKEQCNAVRNVSARCAHRRAASLNYFAGSEISIRFRSGSRT